MKKILACSLVLGLLVACGKGKFETKPKISIKSIDPEVVPIQGDAVVTLEFFDKEGDVDSLVTLVRKRLNRDVRPIDTTNNFPFRMPQFPDKSQGEIQITLDADNHLKMAKNPRAIPGTVPQAYEPDTILLKFVLKDKGKNVSDTASATIIVQRKP